MFLATILFFKLDENERNWTRIGQILSRKWMAQRKLPVEVHDAFNLFNFHTVLQIKLENSEMHFVQTALIEAFWFLGIYGCAFSSLCINDLPWLFLHVTSEHLLCHCHCFWCRWYICRIVMDAVWIFQIDHQKILFWSYRIYYHGVKLL